ncbi:hypothetical protein BKA82DRAFT_4122753 [Pisolithus tinctorius]|nr:hypothetical protein BKA82DRAFT_4122753 [Pisolithus tinctorius]
MNSSTDNLPASDTHEQEGLLSNVDPEQVEMARTTTSLRTEGRKGDKTAQYAALAAVLVFVLVTWGIVFTNNPASLGWFAYHPILQSSAIACFTYGILTLQPTSQPATKAAGLKRHQIAMFGVGIPCILAGTAFMIYNKSLHSAPHFTTWHGTFGIIAVIWLVAQALIGGASVWFGGAALGGGMKAKAVWKYHRLSGYIVFSLTLFTAYLAGTWSTWVTHHSDFLVRLVGYTIAPLAILFATYTRIRPSKMKFI